MQTEQDDAIPSQVLTDPKALDDFIAMFDGKVEFIKGKLEEINKHRKDGEKQLAFFEDKLEILYKYKEMMEMHGFAVIKQTIDEKGEEMRKVETERLSEKQDFSFDPAHMFCNTDGCLLKFGHRGPCSEDDQDDDSDGWDDD